MSSNAPPWILLVVLVVAAAASSSLSSSSSSTSPSPLVSSGLKNLGNTCYMNAQLQCAYHIPRVRNLVLDPPPRRTKSKEPAEKCDEEDESTTESCSTDENAERESGEEKKEETEDEETMALQALRLLFHDMNLAARNRNLGPAEAKTLCRVLGIPIGEQQDSQEFWKLLLPALNLTPLTDLYQGAFEDYIVALDGSGRERRREESFLDLSLDVSGGSVTTALDNLFGQPELLSEADGNGWRPEKGADKVDAHKGSLLIPHGLPPILQLHLKRFNYDWNTGVTRKLNDPFAFPLELDLSSTCNKDGDASQVIYDLQAIVIHVGVYESGHYYAYVRPDVRNEDSWYRINDEVVTPVTFDEVYTDACGGRAPKLEQSKTPTDVDTPTERKQNPIQRFFGLFSGAGGKPYGYGGRTSNAYVLQYVKRSDVPMLFDQQ